MIPTTIQEMATLIYLMEINEWGVDSNEKLCTKLANESFVAARAFFAVSNRAYPQQEPGLEIPRIGEFPRAKPPKGTRKLSTRQTLATFDTASQEMSQSKDPAEEKQFHGDHQ